MTATISPADASGVVHFAIGASALGDAPIIDGQAVCTSWAPVYGTYTVSATYDGDRTHSASDTSTTQVVKDVTPPTTTATFSPYPNAAGWNRTPVEVTLTATDTESGVDATYYTIDTGARQTYAAPFSVTGDGTHTVTFWSVDKAGNEETPHPSATMKIDATAPSSTCQMALSGPNTVVSLSATDALSGVGQTLYKLDGGGVQTYTAPLTVRWAGDHTIEYWSTDLAGNEETHQTKPVRSTPTVVVRLIDSAGNPLSGGKTQYYSGSWHDIGVTGADGTVSVELPAGTYAFNMEYLGGRVQKNQTVASNSTVTFQTVRALVRLQDSAGNPLAGGKAQFYTGTWRDIGTTGADGSVVAELLPMTYAFSMEYVGGRLQKNQDIGANPNVLFQTVRAAVRLQDGAGNPLAGGKAQYYTGTWRDIGTTGADGSVSAELLPITYAFGMEYLGGRTQKNQNIGADPTVVFQTTRTVVRLIDSAGNPLAGGKVQYYAGTWRDAGVTGADGSVSVDLPAGNYAFSVEYGGARCQKNQNTASDPIVVFQTGRVNSASGTCVQYYAGIWRSFTNDMELLPAAILFRFSDGTANTTAAPIAGTVINIH